MKTIRTLDRTGDSVIQWDETVTTADAEAKAKATFDDWMKKKLPAFLTKREGGKQDEKITRFDQIEVGAEVILVPAIVAG